MSFKSRFLIASFLISSIFSCKQRTGNSGSLAGTGLMVAGAACYEAVKDCAKDADFCQRRRNELRDLARGELETAGLVTEYLALLLAENPNMTKEDALKRASSELGIIMNDNDRFEYGTKDGKLQTRETVEATILAKSLAIAKSFATTKSPDEKRSAATRFQDELNDRAERGTDNIDKDVLETFAKTRHNNYLFYSTLAANDSSEAKGELYTAAAAALSSEAQLLLASGATEGPRFTEIADSYGKLVDAISVLPEGAGKAGAIVAATEVQRLATLFTDNAVDPVIATARNKLFSSDASVADAFETLACVKLKGRVAEFDALQGTPNANPDVSPTTLTLRTVLERATAENAKVGSLKLNGEKDIVKFAAEAEAVANSVKSASGEAVKRVNEETEKMAKRVNERRVGK